jgi:hypothetical protein
MIALDSLLVNNRGEPDMQSMIVFSPPYGTAFMFAPNYNNGPHNIWLMFDTDSNEAVLQWLKDRVSEFEKQVKASVHNEPIVKTVAPPQAVLNRISAMPKEGHDWGGPYKLGATCSKCKQIADGLEKRCSEVVWRPQVGDKVVDKRDGTEYQVESIGDNDRYLMVDGPVLKLNQIEKLEEDS